MVDTVETARNSVLGQIRANPVDSIVAQIIIAFHIVSGMVVPIRYLFLIGDNPCLE